MKRRIRQQYYGQDIFLRTRKDRLQFDARQGVRIVKKVLEDDEGMLPFIRGNDVPYGGPIEASLSLGILDPYLVQ